MIDKNKIKKVIVVGGGISGAAAARELSKTLNISAKDITILEASDEVGGEVKNFSHPQHPSLITPLGAGVIAHNYPIIDVIKEKNIQLEEILPTNRDTVEFTKELKRRSPFGKFTYISDFLWQNVKFAKHVWTYNQACENLSEQAPKDFELSFEEFQQKYKLDKVKTFMTFLWPGYGYGMIDEKESYAFRFFAYMGYTTMLGIGTSLGLVSIKGGYQLLIQKMLEDFDTQTSVQIKNIERSSDGVKVNYAQNEKDISLEADLLVLATSPYSYKNLGMELTAAEKECAEKVTGRPYATVAVRIKNAKPEQIFFPDALSEQGFRHPSFLYTLDNRKLEQDEDGRLCTVYINLAKDDVNFSLEPGTQARKDLEDDLKRFLQTNHIEIDQIQTWPHYNSTVPWKTGIQLQKEELANDLRTIHVGSFLPGSFETVGGASTYAIKSVQRFLNEKVSKSQELLQNLKRSWYFFTVPKAKPVDDDALEKENMHQPHKLSLR